MVHLCELGVIDFSLVTYLSSKNLHICLPCSRGFLETI